MIKPSLKLTLILSVACNSALAAQGTQLGPFRVAPEIGVSLLYNDNVTRRNSNELDSVVTVLNPRVNLTSRQRGQTYLVNFGANIARYAGSSADNYEDMNLGGIANLVLGRNMGLSLSANHQLGHDPRGSTDRGVVRGSEARPDTWSQAGAKSTFSYGHKNRVGFEADLGYLTKSYRDFTLSQKIDDKDEVNVAGRVFYRLLPKTRLFFEASQTMIEYDQNSGRRSDSDVSNYSVGATWTATAKTTGTAKIGYMKKDIDSASFDDFSGGSWQVGVKWKPVSRSTVDINTGRYTSDTTGIGSFLETKDLSINWAHKLMPRLSSIAGVYFSQTDFPGGVRRTLGLDDRSDETISYNLGVNYDVLRWASVGTNVTFTERDSNSDPEDYDNTVFMVTLKAAY